MLLPCGRWKATFFWRRFVDDTFTILLSSHKAEFLKHPNSIDKNIQFTSEEAGFDWLYTLPGCPHNHTMWGFCMLLLALLFLVLFLVAVLVFIFALFIAQAGYLHLWSATCMCFSSVLSSSSLEQMVLALCCNEPTTLYLDATVWLLSHWRYRSVWVGFLYTVVVKFPSLSGVMRTSRKGIEPSIPASSLVNWIFLSMLLRCLRNSALWDDSRMVKVSSTNLLQKKKWLSTCHMAITSAII